MSYLDSEQVKSILQDCFRSKSTEIGKMNLRIQGVADYMSPTGKKSVRAKLLTKDGNIELDFNYLIKEQKVHSSIKNKQLDDSFFITEYLEYKAEVVLRQKLNQLKSETSENYLKRYVSEVIYLLNSNLTDVINGSKWENIPVPDSVLGKYK